MDAKEFKEIMEGIAKANGETIVAAVKTEVDAATKGIVTTDALGQKFEAMGLTDKTIKELTDAVSKQGMEIQQFMAGNKKETFKTVDEIVLEKSKEIAELATTNDRRQTVKINVPTQKTQVTRSSVSSTTMAQRLAEIGELPYLGTTLRPLFQQAQVSPSSNGVIRYYDQNSITRNAANTAEAASKPESAITWIERTLQIEKIADSIPVSKEAWKDVYFIQSEINRLLNINLALAEDAQLWDGNGNTPNLKGIYTFAYAFDYVGDAVAEANIADLISAVKVDITNNRQSKYMPNVALVNPKDLYNLKVQKASDGHYVIAPFQTGTSSVDGIRIVESSQVTENTMLVGDFRFATIYDYEGVTIEMGLINDQFLTNSMTILAEKRLGLLARNVDQYAFCKVTDIDVALAALTAGAT